MNNNLIQLFLDSKRLSKSSQLSYYYDLDQFLTKVDGRVTKDSLLYYQAFLEQLKPSAQKKKRSAINQFLSYLYEYGIFKDYLQLKKNPKLTVPISDNRLINLEFLKKETVFEEGRLLAQMIALIGLTVSEIMLLRTDAIDLDFKLIKIMKPQNLRLCLIPNDIIQYLKPHMEHTYLFDHKGKPYSRQWFFLQLKSYLDDVGLPQLTAQELRRQYILHQKECGKTIMDISKQLGLKSSQSIEKYFH